MQLTPNPTILFLAAGPAALDTIRSLHFFKQLAAVAVPDNASALLADLLLSPDLQDLPRVRIRSHAPGKDLQEAVEKYKPELMLVMGWSFRIAPAVYNAPRLGSFNIHFGPLPEFRGPSPLFEQMRQGRNSLVVTIHRLTEELDAGPVLIDRSIPLKPETTYGQAELALSKLATELVQVAIKILRLGTVAPAREQDEAKAQYYPRPELNDLTIQWSSMTSTTIQNLVRATNPWNQGCLCRTNEGRQIAAAVVRVTDPESNDSSSIAPPGTIMAVDVHRGIAVQTLDNKWVWITTGYLPEGLFDAAGLASLGFEPGQCFQ